MVPVLEILIKILSYIGTFWSICVLYKALPVIVGLFKTKVFAPTEHKHTYGICIAARNEEKVIGNLIDSIANQDYPLDKLHVFVCVNNSTDGTFDIVQQLAKQYQGTLKITAYNRNEDSERTKGYALRYLFDKIEEDFGRNSLEAYFIFDADNVLAPDYLTRMNEAYDEGNKIVVSLRKSKNMDRNWISFSYATHWLENCLEHRGKSLFHLPCRVQGTGFMFDNELVKDGWKYVSLTEDRAFASDAVIMGYDITYCESAEFYDEQPYSLKVTLRQRVRWSKGHLQSAVETCPPLLGNIFGRNKKNRIASYDSFFINFPMSVESIARKILTWLCMIIIAIAVHDNMVGWTIIKNILQSFALIWVAQIFWCILVCLFYRKHLPKMSVGKLIVCCFMYPTFSLIGNWTSYVALFKKVEWKPIPHETVIDIDKLNK